MTKVTAKGPNIDGVDLTKAGMKSILTRMGHPDITLGSINNGVVDVDIDALNKQGFMPILAGLGSTQNSGHWMMLIKGENDEYYLYDPLGEESAKKYFNKLEDHLHVRYNLSIIPTQPDSSMGLCGYWVASAGLRACKALNPETGVPDLKAVGKTINKNMQDELADDGYQKIAGWLHSVAHGFPGDPTSDPQPDATSLRHKLEKDKPAPIPPAKDKPKAKTQSWAGFSMYTDPVVKQAIKHANDKHLGTPYKPGNMEATPATVGGITVYRQTHGLAHTMRTMAYSGVIIEEALKAKQRGENIGTFTDGRTLADVTPNDLRKTLIAQAFFVAGREGEESDTVNYEKYHKLSRKAFLDYIEENKATLVPDVFKDQKEIDYFADIVEDKKSSDGKTLWGASPEHMLVNQAHMVDLVRVKQPPESFLAFYYSVLKPWVGAKGAEAVFAIQREFFHATYENVTGFDSASKEPHLVVSGLGRYLVVNDQPVRDPVKNGQTKGDLTFHSQTHKLKDGERFMRVDEYLAEMGDKFPGFGKTLEGGYPGFSEYQNMMRVSSRERGLCETDVDYCSAQLEKAHKQAKLTPIKKAIQAPTDLKRREPNGDEFAAAHILRQILENPEVIKEDHVLINDTRLEEPFFRELLAKCDMAIVGSLLNKQDMANIDKLMLHEKDTPYRSTGTPVSTKNIGTMWQSEYRKNNTVSVAQALVEMMQDGAWYYTRLNAIAQGRDSGSTFKEVLLTALLIPATAKGIADTQPHHESKPPKRLYRGMYLPDELVEKAFSQSESIISNSAMGLFTDPSADIYRQVQLNNFNHMLANTCLSTSVELGAGEMFGNFVADIEDPDGLLLSKRVGIHAVGSEAEYSVYLPDDVALIPVEVIRASEGQPNIIRLVAMKSPDFLPSFENGFAAKPIIDTQQRKLAEIINSVNNVPESKSTIDGKLADLKSKVLAQSKLPVREFWDKLSHRMSLTDDGKISKDRKEFFDNKVFPALQEAQIALRADRLDMLEAALAKFPSDKQWGAFKSEEANKVKAEMDVIKHQIQNKVLVESRINPSLDKCKEQLEKFNVSGALEALQGLPQNKDWPKNAKAVALKSEFDNAKNLLINNLTPVKETKVQAVISEPEKMKNRYGPLLALATKNLSELEKSTPPKNMDEYKKAAAEVQTMHEELQLIRTEKNRLHTDPQTPVDLTDVQALEVKLQTVKQNLFDHILGYSKTNLVRMSNSQSFPANEARVEHCIELLSKLEKTIEDSPKKVEQQTKLTELKTLFADQQKIYPQLVQLQFKSDELIMELRALCDSQNQKLAAEKAAQQSSGLTGYITGALYAIDGTFLRRDLYLQAKLKEQEFAGFRKALTDDNENTPELIHLLANKSVAKLQQGLGISEEAAEQLKEVLTQLDSPITTEAQIKDQAQLIDKAIVKINEPVPEPELDLDDDEYDETQLWM